MAKQEGTREEKNGEKNIKKKNCKKKKNKAGYTATSCGRVGRGGYARFPTFQLVLTDGRTDDPTDGRIKPLIELRVCN